jgi:hypothetical protein
MNVLGRHFEDILRRFRHVLTTSYFSFSDHFYEHVNSVAMGSPLSPVIANFCVKDFEEKALDLATPQAVLLVSIRGRNLRHLATLIRQAEGLPGPPEQSPAVHSVHHGDRELGPSPFP